MVKLSRRRSRRNSRRVSRKNTLRRKRVNRSRGKAKYRKRASKGLRSSKRYKGGKGSITGRTPSFQTDKKHGIKNRTRPVRKWDAKSHQFVQHDKDRLQSIKDLFVNYKDKVLEFNEHTKATFSHRMRGPLVMEFLNTLIIIPLTRIIDTHKNLCEDKDGIIFQESCNPGSFLLIIEAEGLLTNIRGNINQRTRFLTEMSNIKKNITNRPYIPLTGVPRLEATQEFYPYRYPE